MIADWRETPRLIARAVFSGLVIGSMSVVFALSFAAIVYSAPLVPYLSQGMGLTLLGAVRMGAVGAPSLSYRGTNCQPQDVTVVQLSLAAGAITTAVTAAGSWSIYRWGWQFFTNEALDEAYVPFFGAIGAAWDDAMLARWSASPFALLWPEMDAAFVTSGGNGGGPPATRWPVIVVASA